MAYCDCGGKLRLWRATRKIKGGEKVYRNHRCQYADKGQCDAGAINADDLESLASSYVTMPNILGGVEVHESHLMPGKDHTREIGRRKEALSNLTARLALVPAGGPPWMRYAKPWGPHGSHREA